MVKMLEDCQVNEMVYVWIQDEKAFGMVQEFYNED